MFFQYNEKLIKETIECFKEENGIDITPEQANEHLNCFADLFLAFAEEEPCPPSYEADEAPQVDNRGDSSIGVSNTYGTL